MRPRCLLAVCALVVGLGFSAGVGAPSADAAPVAAPETASVLSVVTGPLNKAKCVVFIVVCAAPEIAKAAANGILGQLSDWVGEGAGWLLRQVITALDSTTRVDLSAGWFREHYRFMTAAGGLLLLPLFLLAVLQGLLRQDWTLMARAAFVYLPGAMILTAVAIAAAQALLATTDALSTELATGNAANTGQLGATFDTLFSAGTNGASLPMFVSFLLGLVIALAALAVWIELILRAGAIYIAAMFLPLFLATAVWPATQRWVRRLVEVLVALIVAKLAIVAILSLGLSAITSKDGVGAAMAGTATFLLASFAPFALLSLVPLVGEIAHHQRESRRGLATATGGSLAWQSARARMMGSRGSSGGGELTTALAAATGGATGAIGYRPMAAAGGSAASSQSSARGVASRLGASGESRGGTPTLVGRPPADGASASSPRAGREQLDSPVGQTPPTQPTGARRAVPEGRPFADPAPPETEAKGAEHTPHSPAPPMLDWTPFEGSRAGSSDGGVPPAEESPGPALAPPPPRQRAGGRERLAPTDISAAARELAPPPESPPPPRPLPPTPAEPPDAA